MKKIRTFSVKNTINSYREIIQQIILQHSINTSPFIIFQALLGHYLDTTAQPSFFARRLIHAMNIPGFNLLEELDVYFANHHTKPDELFALIAAYFYYYAEYHVLDDHLADQTKYQHLKTKVISPVFELREQHQVDVVTALLKVCENEENPYRLVINTIETLSNIDIPKVMQRKVISLLENKIGADVKASLQILQALKKLPVDEDDKQKLIDSLQNMKSMNRELMRGMLNLKDNIHDKMMLIAQCIQHSNPYMRTFALGVVNDYIDQAEPALQHYIMAIVFDRLLNVDPNSLDYYTCKMLCTHLVVRLSNVPFLEVLLAHFNEKGEKQLGVADCLVHIKMTDDELTRVMNAFITQINQPDSNPNLRYYFYKLTATQALSDAQKRVLIKQMIYVWKEIPDFNNSIATKLINLPYTEDDWREFIRFYRQSLPERDRNSIKPFDVSLLDEKQLRYATQFFLARLNDPFQEESGCIGIWSFHHPAFNAQISDKLLDLFRLANNTNQVSLQKTILMTLTYFTPNAVTLPLFIEEIFKLLPHNLRDLRSHALRALEPVMDPEITKGILHFLDQLPLRDLIIKLLTRRNIYDQFAYNIALAECYSDRLNEFYANYLEQVTIPPAEKIEMMHKLFSFMHGNNGNPEFFAALIIREMQATDTIWVLEGLLSYIDKYAHKGQWQHLIAVLAQINKIDFPISYAPRFANILIHTLRITDFHYDWDISETQAVSELFHKIMHVSSHATKMNILVLLDFEMHTILQFHDTLYRSCIQPALAVATERRKVSALPSVTCLPHEIWQRIETHAYTVDIIPKVKH